MTKVMIDRELLERILPVLDKAAFYKFGDPVTPDSKVANDLRTELLANHTKQGENVREWVQVSERLPADSRDVLVYCSDTDEHMVGSSMGCGRFTFAFSERGTRICCKPSHWRYIDEGDKPAALAASAEGVKDE